MLVSVTFANVLCDMSHTHDIGVEKRLSKHEVLQWRPRVTSPSEVTENQGFHQHSHKKISKRVELSLYIYTCKILRNWTRMGNCHTTSIKAVSMQHYGEDLVKLQQRCSNQVVYSPDQTVKYSYERRSHGNDAAAMALKDLLITHHGFSRGCGDAYCNRCFQTVL